ncbi:hypothetical protein DH2020_049961 [Rehmannia glutinosa]|uniref:Metalloenzyme domain-containing protein n=1 Tax=Rehmannia glutinosa TaxID=99300 RepID=A0ABR0U1H2_REHGL
MGSSGFSWKLKDHPKLPKGKTIAMVVLDGWGEAKPNQYNCIHVAETPTMDSLKNVISRIFAILGAPERWRLVRAHGKAVGLPTEDDMGNSEVGHNALGAGRIYAQGNPRVRASHPVKAPWRWLYSGPTRFVDPPLGGSQTQSGRMTPLLASTPLMSQNVALSSAAGPSSWAVATRSLLLFHPSRSRWDDSLTSPRCVADDSITDHAMHFSNTHT